MDVLTEEIVVVALGGALGSVMRFMLSRLIQFLFPFSELPWGIIVVNMLGCFAFGVLYCVFEYNLMLSPLWRAGLLIGVLGGFTTFSSFSFDTFHMLHRGAVFYASINVLLSVFGCLMATFVGYYLMRLLLI